VKDVDDKAMLVEPGDRVDGDAGGGLRRRQSGSLERPSGCAHTCGTREGHGDAQQRPVHIAGGYGSIMSRI
jgi:hypothetical protein